MYVNKIDGLIDNVINDFADKLLNRTPLFKKLRGEQNFVKYQAEITQLFKKYMDTIDQKEVEQITSIPENVGKIIEIIKRYIAYFLFLAIAFYYEGKKETYINNIIEVSKNQASTGYKIENFFNSENNANLVEYFNLIKNTVQLMELDKNKMATAAKNREMRPTIEFLDSYDPQYVLTNFKLSNLKNNREVQAQNIIKTIIINYLYARQEKEDVFAILDTVEKEGGTYIFIDIVVPRTKQIDFSMIERVLTDRELRDGMANEIYEYLTAHDGQIVEELSIDEKLRRLIEAKLIIPVVEDFMLYHKDTERYEKNTQQNQKSKKKEDTRIRYIVSKIDHAADRQTESIRKNSESVKNIEKLFYTPLADRDAVLINEIEEVNIISKLHNQGRRSLENNEYYNDLMNFRQYPYVNYKEFRNHGFTLKLRKTVDIVRQISFKSDNLKRKDLLQTRVGNFIRPVNIVGFIIPSSVKPINCYRGSELIDLKKKLKTKNGYAAISHYIRRRMFEGKNHTPMYLKIDAENDSVRFDKFVRSSKMNAHEMSKLIYAQLYDELLGDLVRRVLNRLESKEGVPMHRIFAEIRRVEKMYFPIPDHSPLWEEIYSRVYHQLVEKSELKYDVKDDQFHGLFGKVIKLPSADPPKPSQVPTIRIEQQLIVAADSRDETDATLAAAICQHLVTWDEMNGLRKSFPTRFNSLLFEFIQRYVIENHHQDYVCKSCGTLINIKKFVPDGMFDNDSQKFITLSMPMEVQLEDLPEYDKFKLTIRSIDKIVERMASISNIPYFIGASIAVKIRRRGMVKDSIDLILLHNKTMKKYYRERKDKMKALYGINRELTNLFVFQLDEGIFVYSSKERDYYKHIKHNNVLIYIILNMLLDLNKTQITYLAGDKNCNFYWFEKVGHILFDGLKIIVNNKGDTEEMTNYPVFCYLVYLMACFVAKYHIWFYAGNDEVVKQSKVKMNILIQKVFIHTFVDVLNSILEVDGKIREENYLYEITQMKFYIRLRTVFNDESITKYLNKEQQKKIVTIGDKRKYLVTKVAAIKLEGRYKPFYYDTQKTFFKSWTTQKPPFLRAHRPPRYLSINSITNAPDGRFHQWQLKGKTYISTATGEPIEKVGLDQTLTDQATRNYRMIMLQKLAEKYCPTGEWHNFVYRADKKIDVCKRCQFSSGLELPKEKLLELETALKKRDEKRKSKIERAANAQKNYFEQRRNRADETIKVIKQEYSKLKESKQDYFSFIDRFVDRLKNVIGTDQKIEGTNVYLRHNAYIIDHDHHGNLLDKAIVISDADKKFGYKSNHPFFKTDVLFYTNLKQGRIDVYYDAITHVLLGYKESHRDYIHHQKMKRYIRINYSVRERIKLLGYISKYQNTRPWKQKLGAVYRDQAEELMKKIVGDISRDRILNLKSSIRTLQRALHQVKYKFSNFVPPDDDERQVDMLDDYRKRIQSLHLKNSEGKHKAFNHWRDLTENLFFIDLSKRVVNIDPKAHYYSVDEISNYDAHGNLILFYLVRELNKLLDYNPNKTVQIHIVNLIIDLINHLYSEFSQEDIFHTMEMKRFQYKLRSRGFLYDIEQKGHGLDEQTEGAYQEYRDADDPVDEEVVEREFDNFQSSQALDVDSDAEDFEEDYEPDMSRVMERQF